MSTINLNIEYKSPELIVSTINLMQVMNNMALASFTWEVSVYVKSLTGEQVSSPRLGSLDLAVRYRAGRKQLEWVCRLLH